MKVLLFRRPDAPEILIGANGAAWSIEISPERRSSSSARNATACSTRESSPTSASKSNRVRRRSTARNRSRNCATGGKRSAMCASDTSGGGTASSRSAAASRSRLLRRELQLDLRRERRRADPEEAVALGREPLAQPRRRLLHPPVLGEPPRELLGRRLRLELGELGRLLGEEAARLQLEQRRDEDEELAARLEVELVPLGEPLEEREHDAGDVDLAQVELVLEDERQQQVERPLERVEVELELPDDHAGDPSAHYRTRPFGTAIARARRDRPRPLRRRRLRLDGLRRNCHQTKNATERDEARRARPRS